MFVLTRITENLETQSILGLAIGWCLCIVKTLRPLYTVAGR